MKHITCIEICAVAQAPGTTAFFDYADRGSYSETTLRANAPISRPSSFAAILVDIRARTSTTIPAKSIAAAEPGAGRTIGMQPQRTAKSPPAAPRSRPASRSR